MDQVNPRIPRGVITFWREQVLWQGHFVVIIHPSIWHGDSSYMLCCEESTLRRKSSIWCLCGLKRNGPCSLRWLSHLIGRVVVSHFFVFWELDHLATEQALHSSIVVIMLNLKLIFLATMFTKLNTCGYLHKPYVEKCGKLLAMIFIEI